MTRRVYFTDPEDEEVEIEERKFVSIESTVVSIPNDAHSVVKGFKSLPLLVDSSQLVTY